VQLNDILRASSEQAEQEPPRVRDPKPQRSLALLTCMDVRLDPVKTMLREVGRAHVLRNAGARVTDDVLRSLAISCHTFGVREIGIVHHSGCGLCADEVELHDMIDRAAGMRVPFVLEAFVEPDDALRADVERVLAQPYLPPDLVVWGARYDVETGLVEVIIPPATIDGPVLDSDVTPG
jgi:carbonic anhydrase